jgi:hypothetical protein
LLAFFCSSSARGELAGTHAQILFIDIQARCVEEKGRFARVVSSL